MLPPRGPDVSPRLRWYPVVTFLQLTLDMLMATTAPIGYAMSTPRRTTSTQEITRLTQLLSNPYSATAVATPASAETDF
jgi:uncharacterized membrane protein